MCEPCLPVSAFLKSFLSADVMTQINLENRKTGLYGSNLTAIQLQTLKTKVCILILTETCKCNFSPAGWRSVGGQQRQAPSCPQLPPHYEVPHLPRTAWPKDPKHYLGWGELWGGWATGGNGLWLRQVWCLITRCCNTGIWFLSGQFWLKRGPTTAEVGSKKACLTNKPKRVNSLK